MEYTSLQQLIALLERGGKWHIGVRMLRPFSDPHLQLAYERSIHSCPVCDEMKARKNGFARCFYCRNLAMERAIRERRGFGGLCINGVYEYLLPVVWENEVAAVVFVGNVLPQGEGGKKLRHRLQHTPQLLDTLEHDTDPTQCAALAEAVASYLHALLSRHPQAAAGTDTLIDHIKSYVRENLACPITLSDLGKTFHYNTKYLGRLFKGACGISFSAWLNARRVEYAAGLLARRELDILEISARAGFENVTYFNRLFKAHYGKTPGAYRAELP